MLLVGSLGDRVIHSSLFYICVVHISVFVQNSVRKEKSGDDVHDGMMLWIQKELPFRIFVSIFIHKTHKNY
jgi:hypothetical protein